MPRQLTAKQVHAIVARRLRKYDKLNLMEHFAMFMGKAQLIELGLKNHLMNKYGLDEGKIERWTLGQVIGELDKRGCRPDFVALLKELNKHRKYIAHELLADDAIMRKLMGSKGQRFAWKSLSRGVYVVETTVVVHDFLASNGFL